MSIHEEIEKSHRYTKMTSLKMPNGQTLSHHLYTRFIGKKTELWLFGCGLGDQAVISQIGTAFLDLCKEGKDPELGRVMISCGNGPTSKMWYKGDINVRWTWGITGYTDWFNEFEKSSKIKPDLYLCASHKVLDKIIEEGLKGVLFYQGVYEIFKPLNLEREGLGYAGLNTKSPEMTNTILGPALERGLEWISKDPSEGFMSLPELNEWYNTKQILFGMDWPGNEIYGVVSNRIFESIASGTPYIQYRLKTLNETLGFDYPFQSSSYDETDELIEKILSDYENILETCAEWASIVHREHNYKKRLNNILFPALEALR